MGLRPGWPVSLTLPRRRTGKRGVTDERLAVATYARGPRVYDARMVRGYGTLYSRSGVPSFLVSAIRVSSPGEKLVIPVKPTSAPGDTAHEPIASFSPSESHAYSR